MKLRISKLERSDKCSPAATGFTSKYVQQNNFVPVSPTRRDNASTDQPASLQDGEPIHRYGIPCVLFTTSRETAGGDIASVRSMPSRTVPWYMTSIHLYGVGSYCSVLRPMRSTTSSSKQQRTVVPDVMPVAASRPCPGSPVDLPASPRPCCFLTPIASTKVRSWPRRHGVLRGLATNYPFVQSARLRTGARPHQRQLVAIGNSGVG